MLLVYNSILYLVTQTYHYLISATTPVLQYGRIKIQVFSFISWYHFNIMNCLSLSEDAEAKFLALTLYHLDAFQFLTITYLKMKLLYSFILR
jgi:hypothetical protein